jgi:uncharacterized protein with GYD domain
MLTERVKETRRDKKQERRQKEKTGHQKKTELPIMGAYNFSSKCFDEEAMAVLKFCLKFVVASKSMRETPMCSLQDECMARDVFWHVQNCN